MTEDWNISISWDEPQTKQDGKIVSSIKVIEDKAIKRILKNTEIHTIKANSLKKLCQFPKKNEQYRIITEKSFNAFSLILAVLEKYIIEDLYVAIYRINEPSVISLIDFIESGKIKKAHFVISNFFNQTKKPEVWAKKLKDFASGRDNVFHSYVHNHSKVVAILTNEGDHFVFEGSGNMSDNARIEQYIYDNNQDVYNFHKEWIGRITNGL